MLPFLILYKCCLSLQVNVVEVSIETADESYVDPVDGLQHFVVTCPIGGSCTNTSNHLAIGPGNRFNIYGELAALSTDEWFYDHATRKLTYNTPYEGRPTKVVVPTATAVMKIVGRERPDQCSFSQPVGGRSPGSALEVLKPMTLEQCMSRCCADDRCLAFERNSAHCYVFGRRYDGPNFVNESGSNTSIVANVLRRDVAFLDTGDIFISGISFVDTDFSYYGYQEGWGQTDEATGMPRDAAVVVEGAQRVTINDCAFEQLGGGGIHISRRSQSVEVSDSKFSSLGQSGVVVSGNSSTQPVQITVQNNTMEHIGQILASAAGIFASTVSLSNFADNDIRYTSRWGIAVRGGYGSATGPAESHGNRIERNKLSQLAQTTRDLGGLSFIGQGVANTTVRHNCVRDIIGMDMDDEGRLLRPFFSWSVYLDNYASGFTVDSNILNGNVLGGVFLHGGKDNSVVNNIMHRSNNASMPPPGHYGHCDGSQGMLIGDMGPTLSNNTFMRNIIVSQAARRDEIAFLHATHLKPDAFSNSTVGSKFDNNLFFNSLFDDPEKWPSSTPLGPFSAWEAAGYGVHSIVADPKFRDASQGDFELVDSSPALRMGFVPLPRGLDQC